MNRALATEFQAELKAAPEDAATEISLIELAGLPPSHFDKYNVLGNRYLCVGGMMLFIGPTGCGKSTAGNQQDFCWTLGREAFGIAPARPLKILYVTSETMRVIWPRWCEASSNTWT